MQGGSGGQRKAEEPDKSVRRSRGQDDGSAAEDAGGGHRCSAVAPLSNVGGGQFSRGMSRAFASRVYRPTEPRQEVIVDGRIKDMEMEERGA